MKSNEILIGAYRKTGEGPREGGFPVRPMKKKPTSGFFSAPYVIELRHVSFIGGC